MFKLRSVNCCWSIEGTECHNSEIAERLKENPLSKEQVCSESDCTYYAMVKKRRDLIWCK